MDDGCATTPRALPSPSSSASFPIGAILAAPGDDDENGQAFFDQNESMQFSAERGNRRMALSSRLSREGITALFKALICAIISARMTKFSRKQQMLMLQVAVPASLVNSPTLKEYLIESLHRANTMAFEVFRKKGMQFPFRRCRESPARNTGTSGLCASAPTNTVINYSYVSDAAVSGFREFFTLCGKSSWTFNPNERFG
jgi:hypothetical protein